MLDYLFGLRAYLAVNMLKMNSLFDLRVKTSQKSTRYKGCHDNQCVRARTSEKNMVKMFTFLSGKTNITKPVLLGSPHKAKMYL